jgi:hypothetical protein
LRPIKRAAEDDKTTLVDGTMNANSATKPGMMPIKNLAKNGPVGVLKPRCTMGPARIYPWRKMHRSRAPSIAPGTFFVAQPWADCITNMPGFNLRQAQVLDYFRKLMAFLPPDAPAWDDASQQMADLGQGRRRDSWAGFHASRQRHGDTSRPVNRIRIMWLWNVRSSQN